MIDDTLDDDFETEIDDNEDEEGIEEGSDGLEGEGEAGAERSQEGQEHAQKDEGDEGRVLSRASKRFSSLSNENKALKASQETIRRELDDLRAAQQQRQQQPDPAQERMRYEAMSDFEKLQYDFNRGRQEDRAHRQVLEVQLWASQDKSDFSALCSTNEKASKRADRVEKEFQDRLRAGKGVDRQTILRWMIGDDVLKSKAVAKRASVGKKNIARQRTNPMSGRGDAGGERRGGKTAAERLEGVTF